MENNKNIIKFGLFASKMKQSPNQKKLKSSGILSNFHMSKNMPLVNIQKPISKIINYKLNND